MQNQERTRGHKLAATILLSMLALMLNARHLIAADDPQGAVSGLKPKYADVGGIRTRYYEMGSGEPMVSSKVGIIIRMLERREGSARKPQHRTNSGVAGVFLNRSGLVISFDVSWMAELKIGVSGALRAYSANVSCSAFEGPCGPKWG